MRKKEYCLHYRFTVSWGGAVIPGVSHASALQRSVEVLQLREGADPTHTHPLPGSWKFEPITLERGVSHDTAFATWADLVSGPGAGTAPIHQEVRIELHDPKGTVAMIYDLHRCWPSSYAAFERLVNDGKSCLMEALTLQFEGWTRTVPLKLTPAGRRRRPAKPILPFG